MTNNLDANRSTLTKKSIDFDSNRKPTFDLNEQSSNSTVIEQKQIQLYVNNSVNIDSNHEQKSAYKIPSPTILLPNEFPSSSKSITSSNMTINKISRSTPSDTHRNLLIFNQPSSFYLKQHPEEFIPTSEKFSAASINLTQTISSQQIQTSDHTNRISSTQLNLSIRQSSLQSLVSQMANDILSTSVLPSSQDFRSLENIPNASPFEISPQVKSRPPEIKHEIESLWKSKFTLKTLLSIANRDEAQALKNRKPIDYHMFLSNKWKKNSILQYHDHMERKFTANNKHSVIEQVNEEDYRENRKLYKRLLDTMGIGKPKEMEVMISDKPKKTKRKTRIKPSTIIQENSSTSFDDLTNKPILITYQAIPIPLINK